MREQRSDPLLGFVLDGRFRIERLLGEGGMGKVYVATQLSVERRVAVKVLRDGNAALDVAKQRFLREAKVVANLSHPGIVRLIEYGELPDEGLLYIAMDYVEGTPLTDTIAQGRMHWTRALPIAARIAEALQEAHTHGIIHRDLKPDNVMLTSTSGGTVRPMVLDFGIARTEEADIKLTDTGSVWGTADYMAPEQARGQETGAAADLYALGAMTFEMITGRLPIQAANPMATMITKVKEAAPSLREYGADVPDEAIALVDSMLQRDPALRPPSAASVVSAIRQLLGSGSLTLVTGPDGELANIIAPHTGERDKLSRPPVAQSTQPAEVASSVGTIVLGLVVGVGAVLALLWVLSSRSDDVPEQVPVPPPMAEKVREPEVRLADAGAPAPPADAGEVAAVMLPEVEPPPPESGCGVVPPFIGRKTFSPSVGGRAVNYYVYVPKSYSSDHPHPLVFLFHDATVGGTHELTSRGFQELAETERFIVVAPNSFLPMPAWREPQDIERFEHIRDDLQATFCVDENRIFAFGHGSGGRMAQRLGCEGRVSAMATTQFRHSTGREICGSRPAVPMLQFHGDRDPLNPLDGGMNCRGVPTPTLSETEGRWRELYACGDNEKRFFRHKGGTCTTWKCDEAPYVSCLIKGGGLWPGEPAPVVSLCPSPPTSFPFRDVIWKFFAAEGIDVPRLAYVNGEPPGPANPHPHSDN